MFYSSQLLSRKTPLGICWLASHSESKRLKRAQVFEFSISQSCDSIINPEAPLALRLSGQLLLGVVRIYQRKLAFLETDAKNAIDGLQRKDGSQNVDLPDGGTAPENAITLPDTDPAFFTGTQDLFPSFNVSATPGLGTGATSSLARLSTGGESLTMAGDISDVFGSTRWTGSDERMELFGAATLDEQFSTELERLRSQAAVEVPRNDEPIFYDAPDDDYGPMDDIMEPPDADFFEAPSIFGDAAKTGSMGDFSGLKGTRLSMGTTPGMEMPDVVGPLLAEGPEGPETPSAGRRRRKKTIHLDVDHAGAPAVLLDDDDMKRLLRNRAPLLKKRGMAGPMEETDHSLFTDPAASHLASIQYIAPEISGIVGNIPDSKQAMKKKPVANAAGSPAVFSPLDAGREQDEPGVGGGDDAPYYDDYGGYDDFGPMQDDELPAGQGSGAELLDPLQTETPDDAEEIEEAIMSRDGFTSRTRSVMRHLKNILEPSTGSKRPHESSSAAHATLNLDDIVQGKNRLEACRWFFESLVLRNKGFVDLMQEDAYGTIRVVPQEKMMSSSSA